MTPIRSAPHRGLTLVEMLVAMAATLLLMGSVAQIFSMVGSQTSEARATAETIDRLRSVRQALQSDLEAITVPTLPWLDPTKTAGYLEVVEGGMHNDYDRVTADETRFGDTDDAIAMTIRSHGAPLLVRNGTSTVETDTAEVVWFLKANDQNDPKKLYTLYRIARPVGNSTNGSSPTLDQLTVDRGQRIGTTEFNAWVGDPARLNVDALSNGVRDNAKYFPDIVLTNVLAFDVQVYDPEAPIRGDGTRAFVPSDKGWNGASEVGRGAFVDLGYRQNTNSHFSEGMASNSLTASNAKVWATWPTTYADEKASNGLDDDMLNGVDDPGESTSQPPYNQPLRAIKITIRVWEPAGKQVRQVSVVRNFLPE